MNKLRINEEVMMDAQRAHKVNSGTCCLKGEFVCDNCQTKNGVDNVICRKCGTNNTDTVKELLHTKHSDEKYPFHTNTNNMSADKREQSNVMLNNQLHFAQNSEGGNNNNDLMQAPQYQIQQYQCQQFGSAKNQLINPFKVEKKRQQIQHQLTNDEPEIITSTESKSRKCKYI